MSEVSQSPEMKRLQELIKKAADAGRMDRVKKIRLKMLKLIREKKK